MRGGTDVAPFLRMQTNFKKNHFELFGFPAVFDIDPTELDRIFRTLQSEVHPDRYASAPDMEKRIALQWATQVNEAYRILRQPLSRARYLLALQGIDTQEETNTSMPTEFLMQQMEWREQAEAAHRKHNLQALEHLLGDLKRQELSLQTDLKATLDNKVWQQAALLVRKLRFIEKLEEEIYLAREAIEA